MSIFGLRKKNPKEALRSNQRAINRAIREMESERIRLEQQEKKIVLEMKTMAKKDQVDAVKIMAKDVVRTRRFIKQFIMMKANMQAVSLKIQTLKSSAEISSAMANITKAMTQMNNKMKLSSMQNILMNFEKQNELIDSKNEMIVDAIDTIIGDEEEDADTEMLVNQVLDEIGITLNQEMNKFSVKETKQQTTTTNQPCQVGELSNQGGPGGNTSGANDGDGNMSDDLLDIENRLNRLKNK